jgi:hypothetical protein
MATGLGVPHVVTPQGPVGTTPEDMQRIIAAEYSTAGIIDGCDVSGTATMEYRVSAGAVVLSTGTDMAIKIPVVATTLPAAAAPATGTRTDLIYVRQLFPTEASPDNTAFVGVTSGALPANSVLLDQRVVPAGATATTATTSVANRKFARPVGGSLGRLHLAVDTGGTVFRPTSKVTRGAGRMYVPTDRDVELTMISTVAMCDADGRTPDQYWFSSVLYKFYVDNQLVRSWERSISRLWDSHQYSFIHAMSEGEHTVHYTVEGQWFPADANPIYKYWTVRHGGTDKFSGDDFRVYDRGVITW